MTRTALRHDVNTRLDEELRDRLLEACRREERSVSAIVRRAIRFYLDSLEKGGRP